MMQQQLTREKAIALAESGAWDSWSHAHMARFQIDQTFLCMPFDRFHEAVEKTLGRQVLTHEFGVNHEGLKAELAGYGKPPTVAEVLAMLPADKTVVVVL